jgi:hypothetical protein
MIQFMADPETYTTSQLVDEDDAHERAHNERGTVPNDKSPISPSMLTRSCSSIPSNATTSPTWGA